MHCCVLLDDVSCVRAAWSCVLRVACLNMVDVFVIRLYLCGIIMRMMSRENRM